MPNEKEIPNTIKSLPQTLGSIAYGPNPALTDACFQSPLCPEQLLKIWESAAEQCSVF